MKPASLGLKPTDDTLTVGPSSSEGASSESSAPGPSSDSQRAFNLLIDEFAERCRIGEEPSIEDYAVRHPEHADLIRRFFPTIALMEGIKRREQGLPVGDLTRSAPARLGEYRVVRELGQGGMGIVYEAVQESLGRPVALKIIPRIHLKASHLKRFRREAEAVARLHHTNIVPIFGIGEHDGQPFYVMQLIRGTALDELLARWAREGPPPGAERWRFIARMGVQAAGAIQYAHEQGVLHRDIKPANFLIDQQQTVWITDFGLAKLAGQNDLTGPGDIVGTLRYLAPEGLRGLADARSDVYGLGLTLYEMLTLRPPFGDLSPSELVKRVREEHPVRPRKLDPSIPRDLETIVLKATAKEPEHRYRSAAALGEDLANFLEDLPIAARRASPFERARRWARRNPLVSPLVGVASGLLILASAIGWAGYVSTGKALEQARANETLSLDLLDKLFERLRVRSMLLPPPPGRAARHRPPMPPEDVEASMERTDVLGRSPDPPLGSPPPSPMVGKSSQGSSGSPNDGAMIEEVLTFYDRFARQNASNSGLKAEAAWAYRRVGAIQASLGRPAEAEQAFRRAISMLEELVKEAPHRPDLRMRLVEASIMSNPWTIDDGELETLEARLRRAAIHVDSLDSLGAPSADAEISRIHVHSKLGSVLRRRGQIDEARTSYNRAIAVADRILAADPRSLRARVDRGDVREALAALEIQEGRLESARVLVDGSLADLKIAAERSGGEMIAARADDLAEDYCRLGHLVAARRIDEWAAKIRRGPASIDEPRGKDAPPDAGLRPE
ncbi:serine/threonine-protein kinase [Aquisphaera insulae]|uniref:serine/threonine-protein kinase n=1 Tax=Aquisphaera insulae TaxID=2712864 RepID=UPI0013EBAEF5|nr:serine/threonine-protein kinase [Aquisphaera insulae]